MIPKSPVCQADIAGGFRREADGSSARPRETSSHFSGLHGLECQDAPAPACPQLLLGASLHLPGPRPWLPRIGSWRRAGASRTFRPALISATAAGAWWMTRICIEQHDVLTCSGCRFDAARQVARVAGTSGDLHPGCRPLRPSRGALAKRPTLT